ncbi:sulfotransferase family protein [Hwanghaeella grinnelliae]|nr:sulfotransferase [Hwanghaeella grinnelliae]
MPETTLPAPVIIVAPMGRSGTNYLKSMLETHSDLYPVDVREDYLNVGAENLNDYVNAVFKMWDGMDGGNYIGPETVGRDDMLQALGKGLLSFIGGDKHPNLRPLTKSPVAGDWDVGLRMFPNANYLLIVRDPRSIAESFLNVRSAWSMNFTLEQLAASWAQRMRAISKTIADNQDAVREGRIVTVRYEKLVADPAGVLNNVLERIGLPPFPEEGAPDEDFPVIGSSFGARTEAGRVDFTPQPKPKDFDPTKRWADWTPAQHHKFNRICGALMKKWGYEPID